MTKSLKNLNFNPLEENTPSNLRLRYKDFSNGKSFLFSVNAWIHNHHGGQVRSAADGSLPTESRPASRGWFKSPATLLKGLSFGRPFFIITLGAWIHNHHGGRDPTSCYTKSMTYVKPWVLCCFCMRFR